MKLEKQGKFFPSIAVINPLIPRRGPSWLLHIPDDKCLD
jgi:hypothetical protein